MNPSHLQVRDVRVRFPGGIEALAGVDLTIEPGETVALVGESGSGKTTLLRLFNRMTDPSEGSVTIDRACATELDPVELRRRTGYVQQEGGLLPHWTVERNVGLVPTLLGWDEGRKRQRVQELLSGFGLSIEEHAKRYPIELSGGQRQRVALARALAADPPVVLLDEPFGALDALTRADAQSTFLDWKRELQKTMVLVTHDLHEAFLFADRVAVLRAGKILQIATPTELQSTPLPGYVEDLIRRATR